MPLVRQGQVIPSAASLGKFARAGSMRDFLNFYSFRDTYFHLDDFGGDTINLDYYAVANNGGTAAASFATNIQNGTGVIRGTGGTDDNSNCSLIGPIIFRGDNNAGMWVRFKVDDVTGWNFEVGLIDAVPGSNGPGVSDVDTPAATAGDCAIVTMDTDQTLTTMAFVTKGSTANQTIKATTLGTVTTPTNATFMDISIQLIGNDAICVVNGGQEVVRHTNGISGNSAGHVEGGISLAPWIYNRGRAAAHRQMDIDAIAVWSDRIA